MRHLNPRKHSSATHDMTDPFLRDLYEPQPDWISSQLPVTVLAVCDDNGSKVAVLVAVLVRSATRTTRIPPSLGKRYGHDRITCYCAPHWHANIITDSKARIRVQRGYYFTYRLRAFTLFDNATRRLSFRNHQKRQEHAQSFAELHDADFVNIILHLSIKVSNTHHRASPSLCRWRQAVYSRSDSKSNSM
ncbi:hypothetical protein BJV78DRAFT_1178750 [Lactifluus subvellereus]|nr:hypothetical protein BJV78DRAFT_1178750 [Lactifluus subvellereus]